MASHSFWTRDFVLHRREVTVALTIAKHRFRDKKIYSCSYTSREIDANTPKDVCESVGAYFAFHGTPVRSYSISGFFFRNPFSSSQTPLNELIDE